jgi:glycosyltransferase involved in cell wall biosynthesis
MRDVFINRFYRPDQSATSQLCGELAEHLASTGMMVAVITSRLCHDNPRADLPACDTLSGVAVHRVWSTRFGRAGLVGRAMDYLSFYVSATLCMLRLARNDTVLVAMTDPPLTSVPAACVARYRKAHLVNWLQDYFPEVAQRLGVLDSGALNAVLRRLRNWSLDCASHNVVIGDRMRAMVADATGRAADVIPNWALEEGAAMDASKLRAQWGLGGRFVVGYSGNLGRAHQLGAVIDAATQLSDESKVAFLFVGDGAQRAQLEQRARELGLRNVIFQPFQPRERLRESLSVPDIHLVSLDARLEGLIVPSKFVGVIALGKPVIWLGDAQGELGSMVRHSGCGVVVAVDDAAQLAAHVRALAHDVQRLAAMGGQAAALWRERFRREQALKSWHSLIFNLGKDPG